MKTESLTAIISTDFDADPDVSYLGEFSRDWAIGCVERKEYTANPNFPLAWFPYILPTISYDEHRKALQKMGMSKHDSDIKARRIIAETCERLESFGTDSGWCMLVVTAKILDSTGAILGVSSLGGVESDAGADYWGEVTQDTIAQAADNAGINVDEISEIVDE